VNEVGLGKRDADPEPQFRGRFVDTTVVTIGLGRIDGAQRAASDAWFTTGGICTTGATRRL
jgi:hypothetical protein